MTSAAQPLTDLVRDALTHTTIRALAARSIDPRTGYTPSKSLIGELARGAPIKLRPELVRALAAGAAPPDQEVALAAARQYCGLDISP